MIGLWPAEHPRTVRRCQVIAEQIKFIYEYEREIGDRINRERDEIKRMLDAFTRDLHDTRSIEVATYSEFHHKHTAAALRVISEASTKHRYAIRGLRHEHAVPRGMILDMMLNDPDCRCGSAGAVSRILSKYLHVIVVTKREDRKLSSKGLMSKMPDGWDGEDLFARYDVAKIKYREPLARDK